jgi:hypothetical protein
MPFRLQYAQNCVIGHDTVSWGEILDVLAHFIDDTHDLMTWNQLRSDQHREGI